MSRRNEKPETTTTLAKKELAPRVSVFIRQVGARMRAIREALGLSLTDVAPPHGFQVSMLSRIENGRQNFVIRTVVRLAYALNVPPHEFFLVESEHIPRPKQHRPAAPSEAKLAKAEREFAEQIGARVRELRELQGMSMLSMEAFSGLTAGQLRDIEAGRVNPSTLTLTRIADVIGVRPHELYIPNEQSGIRSKRS